MSRMHKRDHRGDWTLTTERDPGFFLAWGLGLVPGPDRYLLSLRLTHEQAHALLESVSARPGSPAWAYRGLPDFACRAHDSLIDVRNIELTAAEADQVAHGASPLDILFGWAELGYRLVAEEDWSLR